MREKGKPTGSLNRAEKKKKGKGRDAVVPQTKSVRRASLRRRKRGKKRTEKRGR